MLVYIFIKKLKKMHIFFFFFNDPATTKISPLPLPAPLPISAVAVGLRRHAAGHYLVAEGIQCRCARRARAAVERLRRAIDSRGIGGRVTQKLLVGLVAVFEATGDRDGAGQARDVPRVAQVDVEIPFALHEPAATEA